MIYYLTAYVVFWAVLAGYLLALTRRQSRLVERADRLVERLTQRARERSA